MKKKFLALLVASLSLVGTQMSFAHFPWGSGCGTWYVSGLGSVDWHRDIELTHADAHGDIDFNVGGNGAAAIGYSYGDWRFEIEGAFRYNKIDDIETRITSPVTVSETKSPGGHFRDWALMGNIFYDIPLEDCFSLYIGGGIGIAFKEFEISAYTVSSGGLSAVIGGINEDDTVFAWQVMGGFGYDLSCRITFFAGYRFYATAKPDAPSVNIEGVNIQMGWDDFPYYHCIDIGLRFRL